MPRRDVSIESILTGSQSKSFRALNAHLFPPMGGLPDAVAQPDAVRVGRGTHRSPEEGAAGVAQRGRRRGAGTRGRPVLRVHLVAFRRLGRELDDDNLRGGLKFLRDAIADWLELDDGERTIAWEYTQASTRGREGVAVRFEIIAGPA